MAEESLRIVEQENEIWDRQENEPSLWFMRFQRYYLYRGLARSIRRAWYAFVQENYPTKADSIMASRRGFQTWMKVARDFNWKDRSDAYDVSRNEELHKTVLQASRFLMDESMSAAEALVAALVNPRLSVAAANAILDRVGLPSVSKQELLNANLDFTADEMAKVNKAVKAWELSQEVDVRLTPPGESNV
jgi:hypothetical protein